MAKRVPFSKKIGSVTVSVRFSPGQAVPAFVLAAVSFVLWALRGAWGMGAAMALLFAAAGVVYFEGSERIVRFLDCLWCAGAVLMSGVLGPLMVHVNSFGSIGLLRILLNMAICTAVFCLFLVLTGRMRLSAVCTAVALMLLAFVNSYVFTFRSRELVFTDIYAANTAMSVLGNYDLLPTADQLLGLCPAALVLTLRLCFPRPAAERTGIHRLWGAVVAAVLCLLVHVSSAGMGYYNWSRDGSRRNGLYLNFYLSVRYARVSEPQGYSPEAVDALAERIGQETGDSGRPNIIVIMNEAYGDFRGFDSAPETNIPVTPFLDSLTENTVRGTALASVYGGNTANSEFEFLTGHSMAFLPDSSVPYQQYIREGSFALPGYLGKLGYRCVATHSYHASGWARDRVYPLLGFQESYFLEAYPQEDLIRGYVSDREQLQFMLELLDTCGSDDPVFLFGVTMQNHGGYTYGGADAPDSVTLDDSFGSHPDAEQYLSLLRETDMAMEQFLTALEDYPEDTIVLIFGDHLPMLESSFYEQLNGGPLDTLQEQAALYQVPYILWANYEIEGEAADTSLNYLAGHLLQAAGVPLPAYFRYLSELEEQIPAVSALGYYSLERGCYSLLSEASGTEAELLRGYQILQYNALFDEDHRHEIFQE